MRGIPRQMSHHPGGYRSPCSALKYFQKGEKRLANSRNTFHVISHLYHYSTVGDHICTNSVFLMLEIQVSIMISAATT